MILDIRIQTPRVGLMLQDEVIPDTRIQIPLIGLIVQEIRIMLEEDRLVFRHQRQAQHRVHDRLQRIEEALNLVATPVIITLRAEVHLLHHLVVIIQVAAAEVLAALQDHQVVVDLVEAEAQGRQAEDADNLKN